MNIIVDTDALLALADTNDSLHTKAKALLIKLHLSAAKLLLLPSTLGEFSVLSTIRIGLEQTKAVVEVWTTGSSHKILNINQDLTKLALKIYNEQTSKEESLFDCYLIAAFNQNKIDALFSYDKGFKKKVNEKYKIKLASELFPSLD